MLKRLQKKSSNFDVIRWHKDENERRRLLINIKTYREEDERKQQQLMQNTLIGGKSINDSLWGGSSVNSNYGGGFKTAGNQFFTKRVNTAGQESFRFSQKQNSIDSRGNSRGQIPKFRKPLPGPGTHRSRTVDPSARSKRSNVTNSITI